MPFMFKVGQTYITQESKPVAVLARTELKGYECLQCSDGIFRYDRSTHSSDAGRCTGTDHDYSDPRNFFRFDKKTKLKTYQIEQYICKSASFFLSGPSTSIFTNSHEAIEPLIEALCYITGDDNEDYTATKLTEKE